MSYRIADLDAEAEVVLTRAEWDTARRKFLRWAGRNDDLYPLPVPTGAAWARRVTDLRVGPPGQDAAYLVYGDPASDVAVPPGATPDGGALLPRPRGDLVPGASWFAPNRASWIGRWVADGITEARASGIPTPTSWWYDSRWGRELVYALLPTTAVSGPFAVGPSDTYSFGDDRTDVVLIRSPHPYLPASAIERQRAGPDVWAGDGPNRALRTPVRSRAMSFVRGPGHAALRGDGWLGKLYRRAEPGGVAGALDRIVDVAQDFASTVGNAGRVLARAVSTGDLDALQALAAAALVTVVSGGAGAGLGAQLLQGASVAGSDDPWRAAARVGAVHYAFEVSPLSQAWARSGSVSEPYAGSTTAAESVGPVRAGAVEFSGKTYQVGGFTVSADDVNAAEVWALRLAMVAPEEANRLLQALARAGGYVDLVLARLTIEAEADDEKRARLKAELAVKQATFWNDYGQYIAMAITVIASALGVGELALAGFALLEALYTAGVMAANLEVALDQQRRAELEADREVRRIEAEIAALEAEMAILPVPAGTDAPPMPTGSDAAEWRSWYSFLVSYWQGKPSHIWS